MPLNKQLKSKPILINQESILFLTMLDSTIKTQNLNSALLIPSIEYAQIGSQLSLPEFCFKQDPLAGELCDKFQVKICEALMSTGFGPNDTSGVLSSVYTIAWEILPRLVALMMSVEGDGKQWLEVYKLFAERINQSDLLRSSPQFIFFGPRELSAFNKLLSNESLNNELMREVERIDMLTKDIRELPTEESERVERYRAGAALSALQSIFKLAPDVLTPEARDALSNINSYNGPK